MEELDYFDIEAYAAEDYDDYEDSVDPDYDSED
jgi:hypothetical protein